MDGYLGDSAMMTRRSRAKGISLIEMLVATAIVGIFVLALAGVMRMSHRSWQARDNTMTVSFELRRGIGSMTREIASARSSTLAITPDGRSVTFEVPALDPANGQTLFDGGGNVVWTSGAGQAGWITYTVGGPDGNQLIRTQGANIRVLAYGVSQLQFQRSNPGSRVVVLNLGVQRGATSGRFIQNTNLSTQIRVRN